MSSYDLLIRRLDAFIRRFYLNRLLRGVLVLTTCSLCVFLIFGLGEYYFYFPSLLKIILLVIVGLLGLYAFGAWIVLPLCQMQRLGKRISRDQAATIIGNHFPTVNDKLLNILQLKQQAASRESIDLVLAGIEQKTASIKLVPFERAVDLSRNKKYLPYLLPTVTVIVAIWLLAPYIFTQATHRWLHPATTFTPPAPFSFQIANDHLQVPLNGDFTLKVVVTGEKLPAAVSLITPQTIIPMEQKEKDVFVYTFQQVHQPIRFRLKAGNVQSSEHILNILERPLIDGFHLKIIFPEYTRLGEKEIAGLSDLSVPEGTRLVWTVGASYTDKVAIRFGMSAKVNYLKKKPGQPMWEGSALMVQDTMYTILLKNDKVAEADSFNYHVTVVSDQSPRVLTQQNKDSISGQQILLTGQASDDYGLTRLAFCYTVEAADRKIREEQTIALPPPNGKIFSFQFYFDLSTIVLQPGQQAKYYIAAWDNDGIHGPKKGISEVYTYKRPDEQQLNEQLKENALQISNSLNSSVQQAKTLDARMQEVQKDLLQSKDIGWEKEQNIKSLLQQQMELEDQIEAIKKRFDLQKRQSEQKEFSDEINANQDALEQQLDHLLNKQLAEQLKKLRELLNKKDKSDAFQQLQELQQENKLFHMDLERVQELMKQLELQMKLESMAHRLESLAKEQRALKEKTGDPSVAQEDLAEQQKKLAEGLNQMMQQDFQDIQKANKEQEQPKDLQSMEHEGEKAQEAMEEGSNQLRNSRRNSAQKAQEAAAAHLEQMARSMMQLASGMDMQQVQIDIRAVRQLLSNLLRFSFEQEALMDKEKGISAASPLFPAFAQDQNQLKGNTRMIKDSLFSLSKRLFHLAPAINTQTTQLTQHIDRALEALELRRLSDARIHQRYAMSNANNLALMLNETLSHLMQMQAQGQKGGKSGQSGMPKPGQGKGGTAGQMMKDIITGQQKVGQGIKNAAKGESSGSSGQGEGRQSEQIARLAHQQAALRRQIQQLSSMLNSQGAGGSYAKELKAIQDAMDQNETDLVNKRLTENLQMRQQEILTRMLRAEESIRNQDEDDKRSSKTGKDLPRPIPPELKQYMNDRKAFLELYNTIPPDLKPFYKKMAEAYLNMIR